MATQKFSTGQVIEALRTARGIMAEAAKILGCHRHTVENYIKRHPTVANAYHEQRETLVDIAEGKLIEKVDAGEWPSVRYVLSTLGKHRGYVEQQELGVKIRGKPIIIREVVVELPSKERAHGGDNES